MKFVELTILFLGICLLRNENVNPSWSGSETRRLYGRATPCNKNVVDGVSTPTPTTAPFWKNCVDQHTLYRNEHKVSPLKWSDELKNVSAIWANYLATTGLISRGSKGENLYLTTGTQLPSCADIVKTFYDESKNYNYNNPGWSKETERFTQLVWKNTALLGVTYAKRKDGKYIVVFRYKSQGNYDTKIAFQRNVLRPVVKAKASKMAHAQHITITLAMLFIAVSVF